MNETGLQATDGRQLRGLTWRDGEVLAHDLISLLTLVLSGPLLISAVVCYLTATFLWGIHVPKALGIDIGHYTKRHHPSLYHTINQALLTWVDERPTLYPHKTPVWKTYFTDADGITIPYEVYVDHEAS